MPNMPALPYAELHCVSSFSFLRGASQPGELVARAAELRYEALAITDECSVAGTVRAHMAADAERLKRSARLVRRTGLPQFACGDVHMHCRGRRALQDTLTAIRLNTPPRWR